MPACALAPTAQPSYPVLRSVESVQLLALALSRQSFGRMSTKSKPGIHQLIRPIILLMEPTLQPIPKNLNSHKSLCPFLQKSKRKKATPIKQYVGHAI